MEGSSANVARFLREKALSQPGSAAVISPVGNILREAAEFRTCSFRDLDAQSSRFAIYLRRQGIGKGSRVLLMVRPGFELIEICFALFKLGAVPVVIDPGMGLHSFLNCVRRTQPEAMIGIPLGVWIGRCFARSFRSVKRKIMVRPQLSESVGKMDARGFEMIESAADELAAILFTSGSTGFPKGVRYEHGMFDAQVELIRDAYDIQAGEVDLPMLPIFSLFNPALGMTTVVPQMNPSRPATVNPALIVSAIRTYNVTNSFGSPTLWRKIAGYCETHQIQLPSLKRVLIAGASAPVSLVERMIRLMPHGRVHSPYGATECLPVTSIDSGQIISASGRGTCVGRPLPRVRVKIIPVDAVSLEMTLPAGSVGEIVVTGPTVTREYDQLPEATALAKIVEPDGTIWHRMGDLGYFDDAGDLWFCGRKIERVVTQKGVLYTDPVEAVFSKDHRIARCALIGLGAAPSQIPAIVAEPASDHSLKPDDLREIARSDSIAESIEHYFIHSALPVDVRHNAKIHRLTLKRIYERKLGIG